MYNFLLSVVRNRHILYITHECNQHKTIIIKEMRGGEKMLQSTRFILYYKRTQKNYDD